jgi:hypothetical protein
MLTVERVLTRLKVWIAIKKGKDTKSASWTNYRKWCMVNTAWQACRLDGIKSKLMHVKDNIEKLLTQRAAQKKVSQQQFNFLLKGKY